MRLHWVSMVVLSFVHSAISPSSFAADYYADVNMGDDDKTGTSPDAAWKTITWALKRVVDTEDNQAIIHIAPRRYAPPLEVFPLTPPSYTSLVGNDPTEVVIDAEGTAQVFTLSPHVFISGLTITGGDTTSAGVAGGIYMHWSDGCRVANCIIRGNTSTYGGGLLINCGVAIYPYRAFIELTDCVIYDNYVSRARGGVYVYEGSKVRATRTTPQAIESRRQTMRTSRRPLSMTRRGSWWTARRRRSAGRRSSMT